MTKYTAIHYNLQTRTVISSCTQMSSGCLVAEDASATKSEVDEIMQIMAAVSIKPEEEEEKDKPAPKTPLPGTPPPETPPTVIPEKKPAEEEESSALSKTLLSEADPYFKASSDEESTTYI